MAQQHTPPTSPLTSAVVVGAGATGVAAAVRFAAAGVRVRLVSRRGAGPERAGVEPVAADATDPVRLAEITAGADVLVNCAMPPYDDWPAGFPPLAAALLGAAEATGAGYVMLGNVYGYGPVDGPFTDDLPMAPTSVKGRVRAEMWQAALAAHEAGRVRVTEVRASDFLGAGAYSPPSRSWSATRSSPAGPPPTPATSTCRTPGATPATSPRRSWPPPGTRTPGAGPGTYRPPRSCPYASSPGVSPRKRGCRRRGCAG
ncbi:NAD-dependent epimerase/dehydratase family protein [Actinacidiphila epipremni]|uniref:NAD-dependent epimerase/dehydratase family protein n=1 Tax=Actinacidiphila epipremni TaxID=2053013 RepID=UPI001F0FDE36|nr:NAD-dependent epimerase/dehydratase family protein [Actinacidiphila epipremni]